jgi:hypothetical protein
MRTPQIPSFTLTQNVAVAGEGRLRLMAAAPGCDWGRSNAESAVVSIAVDGTPTGELVLHQGATLSEYTVSLGHLERGTALVSVTFRPDLSPPGAHGVKIENATVDTIPQTHPDYLLWHHAPRLYGRPDNATSDTPLLLLARYRHEGAYTRLAYAFVWSDQDSDRGVFKRMAQDGTPTDIDWVYELYLERKTGRIPKAVVLGAGQRTDPLRGRFVGGHPVLATSTKNNMVSVKGSSPLLFALAPVWAYDESEAPRERALDAFPWALELAAKETQREDSLTSFDPRNYLYVSFHATLPTGGLVAAQVTLKNGQQLVSDRNSPTLTLFKSGWGRTAIALPSGTTPSQIASLSFIRRDKNQTLHRIQSVTAHVLDAQYRPQRVTLPSIY